MAAIQDVITELAAPRPFGIVRTLEHIGMTVFGEERRYAGDEQRGP